MRKPFLFLVLLWAALANAASYGILVNGSDYYAGTQNFSPSDPSFTEWMILNVPLASGDEVQLYDATSRAAWAVSLDSYSVAGIALSGTTKYVVSATGCYDFYLKLKYQADQLYVGAGSDCANYPAQPSDPDDQPQETYAGSAPAQYAGVMLQGFYWDSYADHGYGDTKWATLLPQATEIGQWFDLVWLPPSNWAGSSGGTGYLPLRYDLQTSAWGSKAELKSVINTLHANGARVVADVVVNHVQSSEGWCSVNSFDFKEFGKFTPTMAWICSTDEAFTGNHCTGTKGAADDGYGSEANYEAGRDWDHTNPQVRDMIKAYLKWLRADVGYDGFRYDYCKGFHNSHINEYNTAAEAYFSVMEMWDGNPDVLMSHLNDAGYNTCTFDFGTKYQALNNGIAAGNYGSCKGAGLLGRGKGRYAVTFVDSHDSFQRDGNEFCGAGNSMKNLGKLMQANAYILCMPGTPCVFYPHWVKFKSDIKKVINARYKTGVHNESAVSDEAGNGYYKATITGTNGTIRLLLGPNSGYADTPSGYTLAAKGDGWGVYYKLTAARGDKDTNRTPIGSALFQNESVQHADVQKVIENGTFYIIRDGVRYDAMGQRVQ